MSDESANNDNAVNTLFIGAALLILVIILTTINPIIIITSFIICTLIGSLIYSINFLTLIKTFDFIAFCIANLIVYLLFKNFFEVSQQWIYIGFFLLSIIIVKIEWVLILYKKITSKNDSGEFDEINSDVQFQSLLYIIPVSIKQLYYNTLYSLFPVFLVWLGFLILVYFISPTSIPSINSSQNTEYFAIIIVITISLGIFQYYLKRQEEKVFNKIQLIIKKIDSIINEEVSFERFYIKLKEDNDVDSVKLAKWIISKTDPRIYAREILLDTLRIPKTKDFFLRAISKTRTPLIQLSINYADSNKKFKLIEDACIFDTNSNYHKNLIKKYQDFFSDELDDERYEKIKEQIDVLEFTILTLSNINIIHEIIPVFINIKSQQEFNEFFSKSKRKAEYNPQSYAEFRDLLKMRIYKKMTNQIITFSS